MKKVSKGLTVPNPPVPNRARTEMSSKTKETEEKKTQKEKKKQN